MLALAVAVAAVVAFMTFFYGVLGVIASVALFFNMLLTFAVLALIGAPISLSMIAGVVLTVGLAVDASVLIFERIREETKNGRSLRDAIDIGFGRARVTVLDASATMLIAVAVLLLLSAAPVRAFALAVGIGLLATLFTTFTLTQRLVRAWLGRSHATHLPKGVRTGLFDRLNLRFMAVRNVVFLATAALSLVIAGLLVVGELRLGIDFTGGAAVEIQAKSGNADLFDVSARLTDAGIDILSIDTHGDARRALVRLSAQGEGENAEQTSVLVARGELEDAYNFRRVEVVGPSISGELIDTATLGFVAGLLALVAYIWIRFEWHFAIGAVIALAHDVFFTLGFLAIADIEFNVSAVAALLTVAGYSLNDTMVVYDRIRENLRHFKRMPLPILIDDAINRTLSRTVLTSATTLIALAALALFGGEAAHQDGRALGLPPSARFPLSTLPDRFSSCSASGRNATARARAARRRSRRRREPMAKGIEIREAHFPGRAPIDAYGNGGFRFADMSHRGSILCLPSGIYGWDKTEGTPLTVADLQRVLDEAGEIEVLLVGTGKEIRPLPPEIKAALKERGISSDPMSTGAAVRTFNVMLAESRAVAVALIAV